MYAVITGALFENNNFFVPFDDLRSAQEWAREYSIQHSTHVEIVLLLQPFDLSK